MGQGWLRGMATMAGVALSVVALAAPGDLDPSFGGTGIVRTNMDWGGRESGARVMLRQSDGKLVLGGMGWNGERGFALARYDETGTLDSSFGDRGRVVTVVQQPWISLLGLEDGAHAIVQQADGKLVAAGHGVRDNHFYLVLIRYDAQGALDPSFGDGGIVTVPIQAVDFAVGLAIQPDGKLVAATSDEATEDLALVRLLDDGSLDPTFGTAGVTTLDLGGFDVPGPILVHPDGSLVLAGASTSTRRIVLARVDANGTLDPSFGIGGLSSVPLTGDMLAPVALIEQADGRLVVAANDGNSSTNRIAVLRWLPNGTLDPAFGTGGIVTTTALSTTWAFASGVAQDDQGRLVVAGSRAPGDLVALRYLANGALDSTFGIGGIAAVVLTGHESSAALLRQPDGKLVLGGSSFENLERMLMVRLDGSGTLDPTFGDGGHATTSAGSGFDSATAVVIQPDGKTVAAGWSGGDSFPWLHIALARWESDGRLDVGFGDAGRVTTGFDNFSVGASVLVQQPSGRLVLGSSVFSQESYFILARYEDDGTLDGTFGTGGIVYGTAAGTRAEAFALLQQRDGKLVQSGSSYDGQRSRAVLVRYQPDGTIDTSFATGGVAITSGFEIAVALAQQADGKLLAGGMQMTVARYDVEGRLDPTFGSGGLVSIPGPPFSAIRGIVEQPDGTIVVASDFVVARLTSNGTIDTTFGDQGFVTAPFEQRALTRQADGALLTTGRAPGPNLLGSQVGIARYTAAGALDPSFGSGGLVLTPTAVTSSNPVAMALESDGRLTVVGASDTDFLAARYFTQVTTTSTTSSSSTSSSSSSSSTSSSTTSSSSSSSSTSSSSTSSSSSSSSSTSSSTTSSSSSSSTSSSTSTTTSTSTSTTLACADADADGLCDADDPCTNVGGLRIATKAKLRASRLLAPGGDDVLSVSGLVTLPASPAIDPPARGLRILYADATGPIFDTLVPAGVYDPVTRVGWTVRNGSFKFVDKTRALDLGKVILKANGAVPGQYKVTMKGRGGTYAPASLPVRLVLVVDHPSAASGQCGEWLFPATPPAMPSCVLNGSGSALKCR